MFSQPQRINFWYFEIMSEIRDWLKIVTYTVIGLLVFWLIDTWFNHGETLRVLTRAIRTYF